MDLPSVLLGLIVSCIAFYDYCFLFRHDDLHGVAGFFFYFFSLFGETKHILSDQAHAELDTKCGSPSYLSLMFRHFYPEVHLLHWYMLCT